MIYLVDGHNLIPKLPGMSLQAEDDEQQLIAALQNFARMKRKKLEVYFDRAAIGKAGVEKHGTITAHFIRQGSSADLAIRQRLEKSAKESRKYCVVSSDRAVQNSARVNHAQFISSGEFASEMLAAFRQAGNPSAEKIVAASEEEIAEWLKLFQPSSDESIS